MNWSPSELIQAFLQQKPLPFFEVSKNPSTEKYSQNLLEFSSFYEAFSDVRPALDENHDQMNRLLTNSGMNVEQAVVIHLAAALRNLTHSRINSALSVALLLSNSKTPVLSPQNTWNLLQLIAHTSPMTPIARHFVPKTLTQMVHVFERNPSPFVSLENSRGNYNSLLITINGASGSGKTSISKSIIDSLISKGIPEDHIVHISRDRVLMELYHPSPEKVLENRPTWENVPADEYSVAFREYQKRVPKGQEKPSMVVNKFMRRRINHAIQSGFIVLVDTLALMFVGHAYQLPYGAPVSSEERIRLQKTPNVIFDGYFTRNALRLGVFIGRSELFPTDLQRHNMDLNTQLSIIGERQYPQSLPIRGASANLSQTMQFGMKDLGVLNHLSYVTNWDLSQYTANMIADGVARVFPEMISKNGD